MYAVRRNPFLEPYFGFAKLCIPTLPCAVGDVPGCLLLQSGSDCAYLIRTHLPSRCTVGKQYSRLYAGRCCPPSAKRAEDSSCLESSAPTPKINELNNRKAFNQIELFQPALRWGCIVFLGQALRTFSLILATSWLCNWTSGYEAELDLP